MRAKKLVAVAALTLALALTLARTRHEHEHGATRSHRSNVHSHVHPISMAKAIDDMHRHGHVHQTTIRPTRPSLTHPNRRRQRSRRPTPTGNGDPRPAHRSRRAATLSGKQRRRRLDHDHDLPAGRHPERADYRQDRHGTWTRGDNDGDPKMPRRSRPRRQQPPPPPPPPPEPNQSERWSDGTGSRTLMYMADTRDIATEEPTSIDTASWGLIAAVVNLHYARHHGHDFVLYQMATSSCRHPVFGMKHPAWCKMLPACEDLRIATRCSCSPGTCTFFFLLRQQTIHL